MDNLPPCYRCGCQPCECKDGITLYHADCRDVLPLLGAGTVDLVLTDPPYDDREDLFCTDATREAVGVCVSLWPSLVFWQARGESPFGVPNTTHIWHKSVPIHRGSVTGNVAGHHYERVLCFGIHGRCCVFRVAAIMPNFAACRDELVKHPTQKPLRLMRELLAATKGSAILDPFAGSGTTGRACKDLGRKCIMVEIEEKYCEIAANRLRQEVLF